MSIAETYSVGREFADYEKYYPLVGKKVLAASETPRRVYQNMTSKARQAVVHSMLSLKSLGVCRDVAILIAKLVYTSREEEPWYSPLS